MKIKPRISDWSLPFDMQKPEQHYKSKFVIEVEGGALFYSDKTHDTYPDSYFLLYPRLDINLKTNWYVTNGKKWADMTYNGFLDNKGEFVHSRDRHDCRQVENGLYVDGGNDYFRVVGFVNRPCCTVKIENGELIQIDTKETK